MTISNIYYRYILEYFREDIQQNSQNRVIQAYRSANKVKNSHLKTKINYQILRRISNPGKLENITVFRKSSGLTFNWILSLIFASTTNMSLASEFDLLAEDEPRNSYYIDDASVLSRTLRDEINNTLSDLFQKTGFKLVVATVRKLEFDPDVFGFSEKLFSKWHKSNQGSKNGLLLVVTTGKDGALVGGDSFMKSLGEDLVDSVVSDNITVFTEKEKFNEAVLSSVERIVAVLNGKDDTGAPQRSKSVRKRTYKTKEETDRIKPVTGAIVITLLLIAFIVPMLQFYGYVSKE